MRSSTLGAFPARRVRGAHRLRPVLVLQVRAFQGASLTYVGAEREREEMTQDSVTQASEVYAQLSRESTAEHRIACIAAYGQECSRQALERAATVAQYAASPMPTDETELAGMDSTDYGYRSAARHIAAAIRALIPEGQWLAR